MTLSNCHFQNGMLKVLSTPSSLNWRSIILRYIGDYLGLFQKGNDLFYSRITLNFISIQRFPFNTKTLLGYMVAVVIGSVQTICATSTFANVISMGIGMYLITGAIKYVEKNLNGINNRFNKRNECRLELLAAFANFIQMHSYCKKLSMSFDHGHKWTLFCKFTLNIQALRLRINFALFLD